MDLLRTRQFSRRKQYLFSTLLVLLTASVCFFMVPVIGYRTVSLILLLVVSVNAILFDIFPVLISSLLSAVVWNFFFIPPILTFHIGTAEDGLMFLMYFAIASINAIFTNKIREVEGKAREEAERAKTITLYDTLLNSLSHELRTPVATIIGAVDTLQESQLTPANRDELLAQIEMASTRLNRQVENLLNMSRLESGTLRLHRDWVDVNELIFSVVQKLSTADNRHSIHFVPNNELPLFKLDAGLIEQVLHNLVCNALQHTPEGSSVYIEAQASNDACVLRIADNGKGFPESEIPKVFYKFYRLPNSKVGGSGLGLSIAKGFVEAHNGNIQLSNRPAGGAVFEITLQAEISFMNSLKHE